MVRMMASLTRSNMLPKQDPLHSRAKEAYKDGAAARDAGQSSHVPAWWARQGLQDAWLAGYENKAMPKRWCNG